MLQRPLPAYAVALLCLFAAAVAPAVADDHEKTDAKLSVTPLNLSIVRPVPGVDEDSELARFNGQVGTEVKLLIRAEGKKLIGFDEEASSVTFADDTGRDLIAEGQGFGRLEGLSWFRKSEDGGVATIDVAGRNTPAAGAKSLKITGKAVFRAADKQSTHRQAGAALKQGTTIKAGPVRCEISEAGKPEWGDAAWSVTLKFKGERPAIAELRFLDAEGEPVESSRAGSSRTEVFGKVTSTITYQLDKKLATSTLEFAVWDDVETVELPLDLTVDVGG